MAKIPMDQIRKVPSYSSAAANHEAILFDARSKLLIVAAELLGWDGKMKEEWRDDDSANYAKAEMAAFYIQHLEKDLKSGND